jgi:ribonucleoside-triphosphate reductase (formate)
MVNQQPHRSRGVKVLKAVSSPLRLQILNLLFDKSALSYTELMNELKMNPSRDAGRFAYHLKFMLKAGLVEADVEAKKYYLTDLGKMVLDVADRVEKKAVKPAGMMVRTSHLTLEEFDANKIANSLIKEAKVPAELAQKAAKETEKRLVKSKTKYLTAPLIREVVNGILVEKGYEEYRHKLTRVGMPIHEVTALLESKEAQLDSAETIDKAGQTVLSEYALLNIFPRDIADAHLSGAIHIDNMGTWALKPNEVIHELRYFYQHGIKLSDPQQFSIAPPTDFKSALSVAFDVMLHTSKEINRTQTFSYFNISIAPFATGNEVAKLKENLRLFVLNLNQHVDATLGVELFMSKSLMEKDAIGAEGKVCGKYSNFFQESQLIAQLLVEIFVEECTLKPLLNPKLVLRVSSAALNDEKSLAILEKAHEAAAKSGAVYFANLTKKETENAAFSSSGVKFASDMTGEWETDTLRVGCLGCVSINLPRIAMECEKDPNKFIDLTKERFELAARALSIKSNALKQYGKTSMPFLMQKGNGDTYFRLENCSRIINLAGCREATEILTEKPITSEESRKFLGELITGLLAFKQKLGRKYGKRIYPAFLGDHEAAERLAVLDIERYGVVKSKFSGTRDKPYYSTIKRISIKQGQPLVAPQGTLEMAQLLRGLNAGGSIDVYELDAGEYKLDSLMDFTKRVFDNQASELFTYNRTISFCGNCKKNWAGTIHKCPSCGSMSTLTTFDRFLST